MHTNGMFDPRPAPLLFAKRNDMNQRLPQVWGEDADEWNPGRFLNTESVSQMSIGVYGNL